MKNTQSWNNIIGKRLVLLTLLLSFVFLSACGGFAKEGTELPETSAMATSATAGTPAETTPEPLRSGMIEFCSLDELNEAIRQQTAEQNKGASLPLFYGNTQLPTYYYMAKNPANPAVRDIAGGEGANLGYFYEEDEYGYERVCAWHRRVTIEGKIYAWKREDISWETFEHDGQTYYLLSDDIHHLYYFELEDGLIQINLPAQVGPFENALPFLEVVKITP